MSIDSLQHQALGHQKKIASLQQKKSLELSKVAQETLRSNSAATAATKTNSLSITQTKMRDAQRHQEAAAKHQKEVASIENDIARENNRLNETQKRLNQARAQAQRTDTQERERAELAHKRRLAELDGRITRHDTLHAETIAEIEKLRSLPKQITVLFFASNPLDQQQLRLDEEVRSIGEMIRKSEHRNAVKLDSRWAVRPLDLLQAINECRPSIIHFSGHGSDQDEIVFQDNEGRTKLVSKEAIVQTMSAGSDSIRLVFFNTCYSRQQAEAVVKHVAAAIGMNTSIDDVTARVFSAQFYSAIGFGLSVGKAFQQAKAALMLEGIPEVSTPELFVGAGICASDLVLVQPDVPTDCELPPLDASVP
ncbi:MAG: hypothetical protein EAZ30_13520 [Betaproteobacteria bacterium]|nr:MAG: hypothetical protein EAZ30_13520 [Betaproteobacteria bacterium]